MSRIVSLLISLTIPTLAAAQADHAALARRLYPERAEDRGFVTKLFDVVELHKTRGPLLGGRGPSIRGFGLDQVRFALVTNERGPLIDLVFFNWDLPVFAGLREDHELSRLYGKPVFILANVPKTSVASQGEKHDQLTNFSYVQGARFAEAQSRLFSPDSEPRAALVDWKPHPGFMDRTHPLRRALGTHTLTLLSPARAHTFGADSFPEDLRSIYESMLERQGGRLNVILGMMIHESYHVKEGNDQVNGLAKPRRVEEDRPALDAQLRADAHLRALYTTYARLVFTLGDHLREEHASAAEGAALADLRAIIAELKAKYPNAWAYLWEYEFKEGFAEYASSHSRIQAGLTTYPRVLELLKTDHNNFVYRTGAIGGLYLARRVKAMPFAHEDDHRRSLWELILDQGRITNSPREVATIIKAYAAYPLDEAREINLVTEYLDSTIMPVE